MPRVCRSLNSSSSSCQYNSEPVKSLCYLHLALSNCCKCSQLTVLLAKPFFMADPSSNPASFFQHSHGFNYVNSNVYNVAGNMDVVHNHNDQGCGLFSDMSEVIPWSTESPRIVSKGNIELLDQLASSKHYYIHSGKYEQRFVLVKVFRGIQAKKNFKEEKKQNQRLLHPSLLKMIGVSSFTTERPFIVYNFAPSRGSVETRLASVLAKDLLDILLLGCKIVSELAIGLDYLSSEGARAGSSDNNSIEIFITDDDVLKIAPDFSSLQIEDGSRHDESNIDPLWGLFNDLCIKELKYNRLSNKQPAFYIRLLLPSPADVRNRKVSSTIAEASSTVTDVLGDTEGLASGVSSNPYFNEPEGSVSPRRELLWRESSGGSRSVHAVAKHYREFWEHLKITEAGRQSYRAYAHMIRRIRAAKPLSPVVHRCPGYHKEEVTLTSDVADNAIISHFIPTLRERCPVCGEIVTEETFGCICHQNDDGLSATVKCSTCGFWQHRSCVGRPRANNAPFVCYRCKPMSAQSQLASPYSFPPNSPTTSEQEPTIKKKRKRADAVQLKILNETYARTAFPSTDERQALAKQLDMSTRSVQIWFQNKRQLMRQTKQSTFSTGSTVNQAFTFSSPSMSDASTQEAGTNAYETTPAPMTNASYVLRSSQVEGLNFPSLSHRRPRNREAHDPQRHSSQWQSQSGRY
ncbi:hypothetical protein D9758_010018 [Tetrapyrgos nigripes]|uniref:Homeobox domain-containing protein n=1 Tax=Tetrapyrgos nigripes TaxID=182062 RepID=A0A8H5CU11_9AGAR|nr:hypothetical protein D9758_010018 [Tetrapyrgos nigripes]